MFCPKCALQNADGTKFCRGCGIDLSNVLAVIDGRLPDKRELSEKSIELYSLGIRGLLLGLGFLFISGLVFTIAPNGVYFVWFSLAFAFFFLSASVSRFVQAKGIKALNKSNETAALPHSQTEYIKPSRSIYETDDLIGRPLSVTEHTTSHLEMDAEVDAIALPKK